MGKFQMRLLSFCYPYRPRTLDIGNRSKRYSRIIRSRRALTGVGNAKTMRVSYDAPARSISLKILL
jgi:hypothetical protein